MQGVVDADTHIAEPEAMWQLIDEKMAPRRPVLVDLPEDTWFGDRNALWLIDGQIFPKPAGKGSYRLVTPSAQKAEKVRGDIAIASREVANVEARVKDMDRLGVDVQVIYPTLFLVYITDDPELDTALAKAYNSWLGDCLRQVQRPVEVRRGVAAALDPGIAQGDEASQGSRRGGDILSRHRGRQDPRSSLFSSGLRAGGQARHADLHSHRFRRALDAAVLRACAEPHLRPWAGAADLRFPGFARQSHSREISRAAFRLHRSVGGLGAVHDSHSASTVQRPAASTRTAPSCSGHPTFSLPPRPTKTFPTSPNASAKITSSSAPTTATTIRRRKRSWSRACKSGKTFRSRSRKRFSATIRAGCTAWMRKERIERSRRFQRLGYYSRQDARRQVTGSCRHPEWMRGT